MMEPIGYFYCDEKYSYDQPRQGVFAEGGQRHSSIGRVVLEKKQNFEQALIGLDGFDKVWLIYEFHQNSGWKPMVMPPRGAEEKKGVFATRAPYRPNPIGLSCVNLVNIEGITLNVTHYDLLDRTPIWDIKPYVSRVDAFVDVRSGWLDGGVDELKTVSLESHVKEKVEFLKNEDVSIWNFLLKELEYRPCDNQRKRVKKLSTNLYEISYRTWRASFRIEGRQVIILDIYSGYSDGYFEDRYGDQELHRRFIDFFSRSAFE